MEKKYVLELDSIEAQLVINALTKRPFEEVAALLETIRGQMSECNKRHRLQNSTKYRVENSFMAEKDKADAEKAAKAAKTDSDKEGSKCKCYLIMEGEMKEKFED